MEKHRSDTPRHSAVRVTFLVIAAVLDLLGLAGLVVGGLRFTLGPIRVSASNPARVFFLAAVAWMVADAIGRPRTRLVLAMLPLLAFLVAGIAESPPRRVGDAGEYVAMALNLSRGAPPALSASELATTTQRLTSTPGFAGTPLQCPLVGRDGRQDFVHPWLYSLLAAPLVSIADRVGIHLNYAFAMLNLLLVALLCWWLIRNGFSAAATLVAAGPLLWWIDKAHTEVFMFVTLAFAMLLVQRFPFAALLAAALATAQNPAAGVVLIAALASALVVRPRPVSLTAVAGALAIAAITPIYYLWHLGIASPLGATITREMPGFRVLITPLIDPNLGLLPYAPVLVILAGAGAERVPRRTLVVCLAAAGALLAVFAQSGNVNHGGTPGMSRYGLWLLALMMPFVAEGCARLAVTRPVLLRVLMAVSVVFSAYTFRPEWLDRSGASPNWLAETIWTRWPALDNPLPEVFAERVSGRDGAPAVPVGTSGCEKLLIRGDGTEAWWPFPCQPKPVPEACTVKNALCYVNAGVVTVAPLQRRFAFEEATDHAWTTGTMNRFAPVLSLLGTTPRWLRVGGAGARVVDTDQIELPYVVQGSSGLAAWIRSLEKPVTQPAIRVKVAGPSIVQFWHPDTLAPEAKPMALTGGMHTIAVPRATTVLVMVTDAR